MATFKLFISCTLALHRLYMDHFSVINGGGHNPSESPPLCIPVYGPYMVCRWLMWSLCADSKSPYMASICSQICKSGYKNYPRYIVCNIIFVILYVYIYYPGGGRVGLNIVLFVPGFGKHKERYACPYSPYPSHFS
jgi:hypothetical protein